MRRAETRLIEFILLVIVPFLAPSQTQNWVYRIAGDGVAMQVLYNNGSLYAVGSALTRGAFESTFFGPPDDESGGVVRQTGDDGYIVAGVKNFSGLYLIKLDLLGNLAWSKFYSYDTNVIYVCGMEVTSDKGYILVGDTYSGIWLIKTDSLGDTLWTKTYIEARPGLSSKSIQQTLDNGYIITGVTNTNNGDVYLLKTDSFGNMMWTKTYWAPPGQNYQQQGCSVRQTIDGGYVIYATRNITSGNFGAWLLKTDSLGDTLWTKTYNINSYLMPLGCAEQTIDGGYIIAGSFGLGPVSSFLLKTNSSGDSLWCKMLNVNNLTQWVDVQQTSDRGYIVTAHDYPSLYLSKRDSLGNDVWTSLYGGGLTAWGSSVYETSDGGYVVAGTLDDITYDIYIIKNSGGPVTKEFTVVNLSQYGEARWIYQYNGPGNQEDVGYTLVRGLDGNFYAGGFAKGTDDNYHFAVVSIDSNGNQRWTYFHPDYATASLLPKTDNTCVVYGWDGNIYVSGYAGNAGAIIMSFTPEGDTNWSYTKPNAMFTSLVYGSDGNLYAAGFHIVSDRDFLITSISLSGNERWSYEKNIGSGDRAISIVYGDDDNLYVCGYLGGAGASDFGVISVDTSGAERWVYNLSTGSEDIGYSLVYGPNDNIYATGGVGFALGLDWAITNLETSGVEKWLYTYDGPAHVDDWSHSIIYGIDDNLYTTGWSEGAPNSPDITVICLDTSNTEQWVYRGPKGWGWAIVQGADSNIYIAADGWSLETGWGFTVISLTPPPGIEEESKSQKLKAEKLKLEVYPNPFGNHLVIKFQIPEQGVASSQYPVASKNGVASSQKSVVSIKIYDATGRLVRCLTLDAKRLTPVVWDGTDDSGRRLPAGIYFIRLESNEFKMTEKAILLK